MKLLRVCCGRLRVTTLAAVAPSAPSAETTHAALSSYSTSRAREAVGGMGCCKSKPKEDAKKEDEEKKDGDDAGGAGDADADHHANLDQFKLDAQ